MLSSITNWTIKKSLSYRRKMLEYIANTTSEKVIGLAFALCRMVLNSVTPSSSGTQLRQTKVVLKKDAFL